MGDLVCIEDKSSGRGLEGRVEEEERGKQLTSPVYRHLPSANPQVCAGDQ